MSKGKQPRTKVKVPKLLFSENQEGILLSQLVDGLRGSHNLKTYRMMWDIIYVGETIKLRGLPKAFGTKL